MRLFPLLSTVEDADKTLLWVHSDWGQSDRTNQVSSEQAQLRTFNAWRREMFGCQLRPRLVEAKLLASGLETPPDHPGNRPGPGHPLAELGIVVLAAAHVADQVEDMTITVWKI